MAGLCSKLLSQCRRSKPSRAGKKSKAKRDASDRQQWTASKPRIDAAIRRAWLHRRPGRGQGEAAESAEIEAKYNVARTYLWKSRPELALPLLEEIVRRPWEDRFLMQLPQPIFKPATLPKPNASLRHLRRETCDTAARFFYGRESNSASAIWAAVCRPCSRRRTEPPLPESTSRSAIFVCARSMG